MPAVGGVARRAAKIKYERQQSAHVLVLDAGDSLVGDQDPALKTQGQSSVTVMNLMGYDAVALGPQDLALGPAVLRQRIAEAKFAFVSANALVSSTGQLVAKPFVVRNFDGVRVAVVGLSAGGVVGQIQVRDPLATARQIVPEAAKQAEIVIVLSHAGAEVDQQIAAQVPGITAVVSGGQGSLVTAWQSPETKTWRWHADQASRGHAGRLIGVGKLAFDAQGKLAQHSWSAFSLDPEVADDAEMAAWVKQAVGQ